MPDCYQANDSVRRISNREYTKREMGLPETGFIFCCFNNNYKILPPTFDGWMRILKAVPGSVLWLLADNRSAENNLLDEAESRGVDGSRLVFASRMAQAEHLARHRLADLFLDTYPCNAHTTASDALWSDLPVLTYMGQSFASRVAASLLNALSMPELVTQSQSEYEAKAIEIAGNPSLLQYLKYKLQTNKLDGNLFKGKQLTLNIEFAYEAMIALYRAGKLPEKIDVANLDLS